MADEKAQEIEQNQEQQAPELKGKIQVRIAVLIFCKDLASPMVLYFDNPQNVYDEVKALINSTDVKMVEFEPSGPIKKAALLSSSIVSVALQEERYLIQE